MHGQPLIPTVEELKDEDEEVDDVEVELDGRQDVVVRPHFVVYHVCVCVCVCVDKSISI